MGSLPDETVIKMLTGMKNISVPDFVKLFDFLLQQAKAKVLEWHFSNRSARCFNVVCWNCGCSINKGPQPKDEKKTATNRKKFSEQK